MLLKFKQNNTDSKFIAKKIKMFLPQMNKTKRDHFVR